MCSFPDMVLSEIQYSAQAGSKTSQFTEAALNVKGKQPDNIPRGAHDADSKYLAAARSFQQFFEQTTGRPCMFDEPCSLLFVA